MEGPNSIGSYIKVLGTIGATMKGSYTTMEGSGVMNAFVGWVGLTIWE